MYLGRGTHVPRSGYACTSVGVRMYLGRGTMTMWFISENKKVHLMEQKNATGCIQQLLSAARGFYLLNAKVQLYYNNVGKIGTRKLASIASLKQFLHKIMQI